MGLIESENDSDLAHGGRPISVYMSCIFGG